ncbi:hypothetical protein KFK09_027183 [Dendrobium nobile]|uniref:Uncharacterized protein n=1 Tax=Dendrobium nobile TaxID=94219 RepID=A0A8T3A8Z4_DENNO|nr:hypothetical protein KFK09_027183 [Dendrobium nobile]
MNTPLLPIAPAPSPSTSTIIARLTFFLVLAATSLWANHQSSNLPFSISVPTNSPSRRFDLLFASNGRASAAIFRAASLIDSILFPNPLLYPRKPVRQISLQLSPCNLSSVSFDSTAESFTIFLSADIAAEALAAAVTKGVARVLLWDGGGEAPSEMIEALGNYLSAAVAGDSLVLRGTGREEGKCFGEAGFVEYCERQMPGFVARLNKGMRDRWREEMVDDALGFPATRACAEFRRRRGLQGVMSSEEEWGRRTERRTKSGGF